MAISRSILSFYIFFLISFSCIGGSYALTKVFVPANTIVETESYGICSSLEVQIDEKQDFHDYPTWVAIVGFIDDEYVGKCNSTSSSCRLDLSNWTGGHKFTYYSSSNTDAYFHSELKCRQCDIVTFYNLCGVFGIFGVLMLGTVKRRRDESVN